jgi:hypothetical protein
MQESLKKKLPKFYLLGGLLLAAVLLIVTLLAFRLSRAHAQVTKTTTTFTLPYSLVQQQTTNSRCNIIERGWLGKELNCYYTGIKLYKNTGQPLQALMAANVMLEAIGYQPDAATPGSATPGPNDFESAVKNGHPSVFNYSDKKGNSLQLAYITDPRYLPKELEGLKNVPVTKDNYLIGIFISKSYVDLRL